MVRGAILLLLLVVSSAHAQDCTRAMRSARAPARGEESHLAWRTACAPIGDATVAVATLGGRIRLVVSRGGRVVARTEWPGSMLAPEARGLGLAWRAPTIAADERDPSTTAQIMLRTVRGTLTWRVRVDGALTSLASWLDAEPSQPSTPIVLPEMRAWPAVRDWPASELTDPAHFYVGAELDAIEAARAAFHALQMGWRNELDRALTPDATWIDAREEEASSACDVTFARAGIDRARAHAAADPPDGAGLLAMRIEHQGTDLIVHAQTMRVSFMGEEHDVGGARFRIVQVGTALRVAEMRTWPEWYGYIDQSSRFDAASWAAADATVEHARERDDAAHQSLASRRMLIVELFYAHRYAEALEMARALCDAAHPAARDLRILAMIERRVGHDEEARAVERRMRH